MLVPSDDRASSTRIQSVARAARLLRLLAAHPSGMAAAHAARELGLTVPTTHHLLNTLTAEGLVVKDAQRRFGLGPAVTALAQGFVRQVVPEYLRRPLAALVERTGETAYLAVWGTGEIHVLASVAGARPVRVGETASGPYRHAHARATGKLLLAYAPPELRAAYLDAHPPERLTPATIVAPDALEAELAEIRRRGYSEDHEEFVEGVSCVSAPMLSGDTIVAAFTVAAPTPRYETRREELRSAVLAAAGSSQTEPGRAP